MKSRGLNILGYTQGPESGAEKGRVVPTDEAGEKETPSRRSLRATLPAQ